MNLRDHTLAWLDSIGADGLMTSKGNYYAKEDLTGLKFFWIDSVPAYRHTDGSYHAEPEGPQTCGECWHQPMTRCTKKDKCMNYKSWLAHKETK